MHPAPAAQAGPQSVAGADATGLCPDALLRASREEARLYRELGNGYDRLTTLLRERRFDELADATSAAQGLLEQLRCLGSRLGPVRNEIDSRWVPPSPLRSLWAETATLVSDALAARDRVLLALASASQETREALSRLRLGRSAMGRYRSARSGAARIRSLTV